MQLIGAHELRTHLGRLLEGLQRGEQYAVTKNGREVGWLIPSPRGKSRAEEAIARLTARREQYRAEGKLMTTEEILSGRDAGRR